MCGIVGFVGQGDIKDLQKMMHALSHRGPDGDGTYIDTATSLFLGHQRLAIVDLEQGHQPMHTADKRLSVICNGEIYNHLELRTLLEQKGYIFRTNHSDIEVLLYGYQEWGNSLPHYLNGMFAFALYDQKQHRLFLARDKFGEKPLYYTYQKGIFAFASELNALQQHSLLSFSIDPISLQKYFAYGYIPSPRSFYKDCFKLPAGHSLSFDFSQCTLHPLPYWQFRLTPSHTLKQAKESDLVEELDFLLTQSVRRRSMSDVPIGVFLSGGLDSSAIVAFLKKTAPSSKINTFTIGFLEKSFDESEYAQQVATLYETTHHVKFFKEDIFYKTIDKVLPALDEPIADPSILPTYLLSQFTAQSVKVALSGDGGDELFAGYDPFKALYLSHLYTSFIPKNVHVFMRHVFSYIPFSQKNMSLDFKLRRTLMGLSYPNPAFWNPVWLSPLEPALFPELFDHPLLPEEIYEEAISLWESSAGESLIDKSLEFFTRFYLQEDILFKTDRASMLNSLEARAVFLDNDLVSFCQKLPSSWKYRNGQTKYLFKKVLEKYLPPSITQRKKKGFGIPLLKWLQTLNISTNTSHLPGVRENFVKRAKKLHNDHENDYRLFLWAWFTINKLYEKK